MTRRYMIRGAVEHVMCTYDTQSRARFWTALVRGDDLTEWGVTTVEITDDYHSRPTLTGTYSDQVNDAR